MFPVVFQLAWRGLGDNPENKWFDKSVSIVVFNNGLVVSGCDVRHFVLCIYGIRTTLRNNIFYFNFLFYLSTHF